MAQRTELFSLSASTPEGAFAHGKALASGSAEARASLRRGVDLSASVQVEGHVSGEAGSQLAAGLTGDVQAGGGLTLQAAIPIDLFDPQARAGLVARLQAQAAASASIAATVSLEVESFRQLLGTRFAPPFEQLLDVFLDELVIEAGIWGRASFAAELYGEALLAGSLMRAASEGPGFTFSTRWGAGLGVGSGVHFLANLGVEDPARLLDRMAATIAELILDEARDYVDSLPPTEAAALAPVTAVAGVLVPLATRLLFRLGGQLAGTEHAAADTAGSVVGSFVRQGQHALLAGLGDWSFRTLGELLAGTGAQRAVFDLDEDRRAQLKLVVEDLSARAATLEARSPVAGIDAWLLDLLDCLGPLDALVGTGVLPHDVEDVCHRAVGIAWAAGVLTHRVLQLAQGTAPPGASFGATPAHAPAGGSIPARVAKRVGRPAGQALTLADLVTYVVGEDPIQEARTALPELGHVLDWLAGALGVPPDQVLETFLVTLVQPGGVQAQQLLTSIGEALRHAVQDQVVPLLLVPMKQHDPGNKGLQLLVDQIVVPLLVSVPAVVVPGLGAAATEEGARRLREAISGVLLQVIGQFVVEAVEVLLEFGTERSEQALRDAAAAVAAFGHDSPILALMASAAATAVLPITPTPADVEAVLELAADVVAIVHDTQGPVLDAAGTVLALGLGAEATRQATFQALTTTDDPPRAQDLDALLAELENGTWRVVSTVAPAALRILALHLVNEVVLLAEAIGQGAKAIVEAAVEAAEWVLQAIHDLPGQLAQLGQKVKELLESIATWVEQLAAHLKGLVGQAVEGVRAYGLALIDPLIKDFPGWVKDGLHTLYNALFDELKWLLELPLSVLQSVAGWVKDLLQARQDVASYDEQAVRDEVSRRIHGANASDVHFDLALTVAGNKIFDIGRITVPTGAITGAIASVVLGDGVFDSTVRNSATAAAQAQAAQSQEKTLSDRLAGALSDQAAAEAAKRLAPGAPLAVQFLEPPSGVTVGSPARVRIRIDGANRTFVEPTLGVPRRVSVVVNRQEYAFQPAHWQDAAGGLELTFDLVLPVPGPPQVSTPGRTAPPVLVDQPTLVKAHVRGGDEVVFTPVSEDAARQLGVWPQPLPDGHAPAVDLRTLPVTVIAAGDPGAAGSGLAAVVEADRTAAGTTGPPAAVRAVGTAMTAPREGAGIAVLDTNATVTGPVAAPLDAQGRPYVPARAGTNALQVAVADGRGKQAGVSRVISVLPSLLVQVEPSPTPLGVDTEFVVRALDTRTGAAAAGEGRVIVDGVELGRVGQAIRHRFRPHPDWHGPPRDGEPVDGLPRGVVRVTGYAQAEIPFDFAPPREASFVAQSLPSSMEPGRSYPVLVTLRNAGGLTWRGGEGYRLGSQAPPDNQTWGLDRVQPPGDVAPGADATFAFTVTAPAELGTYSFQWRMLQEGTGWFGEPSAAVAVEVETVECTALRQAIRWDRLEVARLETELVAVRNDLLRLGEVPELEQRLAEARGTLELAVAEAHRRGCRD
jgi:hypothetical protein